MSRRAARILNAIEEHSNKKEFEPNEAQTKEFKQLINSLRECFFYSDEFNADFRMTLNFIEKYLDQEDFIELLSKFDNFNLIFHPLHEEEYYPLEIFVKPMIHSLASKSSEIKAKTTEVLMKIIDFFLRQLESMQYIETIESLIEFFHEIQEASAFPIVQEIINKISDNQYFKNRINRFLKELSDFKKRIYGKENGMDDVKEFCNRLMAMLN